MQVSRNLESRLLINFITLNNVINLKKKEKKETNNIIKNKVYILKLRKGID